MDPRIAETTETTTFILRFRREWTGAKARWRGRIEHVQSGRRSDFLGVGELLGFLEGFGIHKERIMSATENKAVIARLTQAFNDGNLNALDELVAVNFVGHIPLPPGILEGVDGLKGFFAAFRAAMPDVCHPGWTLIGEGDLVMIHMPTEGTFTNALMGIPPNGRKIVVWMANIWRLDEGQAVEWWLTMDTLGFMQQLGVIPRSAA